MLQLIAPNWVASVSVEPPQHVEVSEKVIAPQFPSSTNDVLETIRTGLCDVANETVHNIQRLSQATVEQAMDIGQRLWRMQRALQRKEYRAFLGVLGWATTKARKFINLAKVFDGFSPSQLSRVELTTLLSLCSKRYSSVVAKLRETQEITQQLVEQLIKENRQVRSLKQEPISGWKQNRVGGTRRYEVILHDEETGVLIEQQASSEGVLPQRVIAEAVALLSQHKSPPAQINEYYAAQLEELQTVVEHARALDSENRKLAHQLMMRERTIAELEAKVASSVASDDVELNDVQEHGVPRETLDKWGQPSNLNLRHALVTSEYGWPHLSIVVVAPRSVETGILDEVTISSTELCEYLESQVLTITSYVEHTTEHESQTAGASDYSKPEQKSEYKEFSNENDCLVKKYQGAQNLEPKPQVFQSGCSVEIVSSRQGATTAIDKWGQPYT